MTAFVDALQGYIMTYQKHAQMQQAKKLGIQRLNNFALCTVYLSSIQSMLNDYIQTHTDVSQHAQKIINDTSGDNEDKQETSLEAKRLASIHVLGSELQRLVTSIVTDSNEAARKEREAVQRRKETDEKKSVDLAVKIHAHSLALESAFGELTKPVTSEGSTATQLANVVSQLAKLNENLAKTGSNSLQ